MHLRSKGASGLPLSGGAQQLFCFGFNFRSRKLGTKLHAQKRNGVGERRKRLRGSATHHRPETHLGGEMVFAQRMQECWNCAGLNASFSELQHRDARACEGREQLLREE